jgi:hypothetical protein
MSRISSRQPAPSNPNLPTAVYGLEAGHRRAQRSQRRRRRSNGIITFVLAVMAVAAVGAAGWFGYLTYVDHSDTEEVERNERVAEFERQRAGEGIADVIEDLEDSPRWNGPGNPTFGVGDEADPVPQP